MRPPKGSCASSFAISLPRDSQVVPAGGGERALDGLRIT